MKTISSWHVGVAAEAYTAAVFARYGYDVSVQYGANQPEYDLIAVSGDKMLKIKKAALGSTPKEKKKISPGGIAAEKGRLFVRTGGKGWIEITELQPAGKRSMTADEYLRGKPAQAGEALG